MRNYCGDCGVPLTEVIEWKYGYCVECFAIRLERAEELTDDEYWEWLYTRGLGPEL